LPSVTVVSDMNLISTTIWKVQSLGIDKLLIYPFILFILLPGQIFCVQGKEAVTGTANQEVTLMVSHEKPGIARISANTAEISLYGKCELTIDLTASYDNPFDPEQIDLTAEFTAPSGKKVTVPGFFYQPYTNKNESDDAKRPLLDTSGPPCWKIRFTPIEIGKYTYVVQLQNHFGDVQGDVKSVPGNFIVTASEVQGFIRVSRTSANYFQFDNGRPFFAVGQNLQNDWPVYKHSRLLAGSGANCARVWTFCHWTWLEWTIKEGGIKWAGPGDWMRSYAGAGKYNQRIAWIADHHLDQWSRDGLYVMLCTGNATGDGEFSSSGKDRYDSWGGNPYNIANGGFLDNPAKFWTDERAKKFYKQRLRYIVARWGYSPHIWAWEFWNELGEARPEIVVWHKEMAQYLRGIDPNRHLITTSTWEGNADKFADVWDLKEMDFTQAHHYGTLTAMMPRIAHHLAHWPKPHIIGEGGGPEPELDAGDSSGEKITLDPDGVEFHNSLWVPVMSGTAGTTLPWWWRERVEPRNLFYHYRAVVNFVRDVPWNDSNFRPIQVRTVSLASNNSGRKFSPVLIAPFGSDWGSRPKQNRFRVEADGTVTNLECLAGELFGNAPNRREWRNPPTFEMNFPEPGQFILHISKPLHSILEIRLDGKLVVHDVFSAGSGKPTKQNFVVEVPAGRHEIALDNAGGDLIRFSYFILTNYRDITRYPDLDVLGLQLENTALIWVHNRLNQWYFKMAGILSQPVGPATVTLNGFQDGNYRVEWWDTYKGEISKIEQTVVHGGTLDLHLPVIENDIACKPKLMK
jgi:hypothetical protein